MKNQRTYEIVFEKLNKKSEIVDSHAIEVTFDADANLLKEIVRAQNALRDAQNALHKHYEKIAHDYARLTCKSNEQYSVEEIAND